MPTILQHRRGTTVCATSSTLCSGELFVDCDLSRVYLHDGATTGGSLLGGSDKKCNIAMGSGSLAANCDGKNNVSVGYNSLAVSQYGVGAVAIGSTLTTNAGCTSEVIGCANFAGCTPPVSPELGIYVCSGTGCGYSTTSCFCGSTPLCGFSGTTPSCIPTATVYFDASGIPSIYGLNGSGAGFARDTVLTIDLALGKGGVAAQIAAPAKAVHNSVTIGQSVFNCLNDTQGLVAIGLRLGENYTCNSSKAVVIGYKVASCAPASGSFCKSVVIGNCMLNCWSPTSSQLQYNSAPIAIGFNTQWQTGNGAVLIGAGIGHEAAIGNCNVIVGSESVYAPFSGCWTGGTGGISNCSDGVTVVGSNSLYSGGMNTTAVGSNAAGYSGNNTNNTFIGACAGNGWNGMSSFCGGCNNTFIGYQSGYTFGFFADNKIVLGNNAVDTIYAAVTSITSNSDCRDKTNVQNLPVGLDFVKKLNPVKFEWNSRDGARVGGIDAGFLAQEVAAVEDEYSSKEYTDLVDRTDAMYSIRMTRFVPVLVKAIQELAAENANLKSRIEALENK